MKLTGMKNVPWVKLGNYIEVCNARNYDLTYGIELIEGVNNKGEFCPPKAATEGIDLQPYKIVNKGDFVYNPSRLDIGSIAFRTSEMCIVSHLYVVFHLTDFGKEYFLPEFLWLFFNRENFCNLVTFRNFGSQRPEFNYYQMCEVEVPMPSIEVQRSLVAVYEGLEKLVADNETLIEQLEKVCHDFVVDCKRKYPKVKLGDYIEECDERNNNNELTLESLKGISTEKKFIETKANMDGVSLSSYKIVHPREFAYVADTSRRGDKIALAINNENKAILISSIYSVFRSQDEDILLPEYLNLLFNRSEFDRYARFNSWGSARETFDFSEMRRVVIPLPPIEIQKSIAAVAHCLQESRRIVQESRELMKNICPALVQKAAHSA